ncbi:Metallo-dependent phosphatase-like protein [Coniochaeta sp. 2T2.1]|nr:Metallo-dependent phosphatase-like protein [Coniochaeta sp. 2T2.1]
MMALKRGVGIALLLLWHGVIASPVGIPRTPEESQQHPFQSVTSAPRKLKGRFLHITDLHPDEFYKIHSSTSEEDTCHRGHGAAGTYGAETSDCDSPLSLVNATFDWIAANLRDEIDFVVWTGDSARHDSDEEIPRSPAQVLGANRLVADMFADAFSDPSGVVMSIPVVPTLGNNDILPHNILLPGPNKWLKYYTDIWRKFIPEEQRHSFEFGGWFYVEVIPNKLAVFSLNTLYFFDRNAGVDDCVTPSEPGYKQMEWLRIQLQFLRNRGMKAILMGHVPPARTESKKLWDETCWQKYTLWLEQFRDVVTGGIYGHMNIDHFMLQDTKDVDIGVVSGESQEFGVREAMEDELSVESTADYLQELRIGWSNLVKPMRGDAREEGHKKGKKGKGRKKHDDPWAERYQLTMVGPSIVPNYFPTLRVVEYNISGLEDAAVWTVGFKSVTAPVEEEELDVDLDQDEEQEAGMTLDLRSDSEIDASKKKGGNKKKHPKKKHPKKPTKPKDPNLIIPEPPSKSTLPGPAYSLQPLTLTGYTQYFANLTHINNDVTPDEEPDHPSHSSWGDWTDWLLKWRKGKHGDKEPKKDRPKPREFGYEVEYSTFDDGVYKLEDLTVRSFVKLASRMAKRVKGKEFVTTGNDTMLPEQLDDPEVFEEDEEEVDDEEQDVEDTDDESEDEEDEFDTAKKGKKDGDKKQHGGKGRKRKGKGGKKKKANKVWLHFLRHAFVSTVEKKELKKMA